MNDRTEQWRPIEGFPGYEVSSLGRIVSYRIWRGRPGPREMRCPDNGQGYRIARLSLDKGGVQQRYVHHLVAEAFIGCRPEGMQIRHLDGDSLNNAASNLMYGTVTENVLDTVRHGRNPWSSETACRNGHRRTAENTAHTSRQRDCLDCRRPRQAARARRARAAAKAAA